MEKSENEISNLDLPVAQVIREALNDLTPDAQREILGPMSPDDFTSHRVDIFLEEVETAMHNGFDELGAKEIALRECLTGLVQDNG